MARNIVSFLVKVGCADIEFDDALEILNRKVSYNNKPAPAHGLYLIKVKY